MTEKMLDFLMVAFVLVYVAALIFIPAFLDHHNCVLQADQAACERIYARSAIVEG